MRQLKDFLEYIEIERGRAVKTVENYDRYLHAFFNFAKIKDVGDITDEAVRNFRLHLNRQNLKKNTQNYHLIALRTFLKYLAWRGVAALAPERIELAKTPQRDLDLITSEELSRLLSAPKNLRDKAILELLFSTGLRVSELCALKVDDVDLRSDEFSVRGKGGKVRVVFVSDSAKQALKNYLDPVRDPPSAFGGVATATLGRPGSNGVDKKSEIDSDLLFNLTSRSVERIVKKYAITAGITRKVTPHTLRHSFATDLLGNGADLRSVQALLGHSNISTTQVYTHVTDKHLRDVHRAFHGRQRRKG